MRKIRIIATFNLSDDVVPDDDIHDAMSVLTEQVENVIIQSDALEAESFGDPVLEGVHVEEERHTWEKWGKL